MTNELAGHLLRLNAKLRAAEAEQQKHSSVANNVRVQTLKEVFDDLLRLAAEGIS
jgi:hypothetical protein